jgi:quinoprotein glucose dehydrogenase
VIQQEIPNMTTRTPIFRIPLLAAFVVGFLAAAGEGSAQVGPTGGEWPVYGGDLGSTRYSPLDQIDASNVGQLEVAWRWSARNFGTRPERNYRVTPIMVDGVLFATAGSRRAAVAIDAVTGETLWFHRMDEGERGRRAPRVNSGRGVAYWEPDNGGQARIFYITPGYQMFALDASSGRPVPGFGDEGVIDLTENMRVPEGLEAVGTIGSSSPPLVVGDVLVVGSAQVSGRRHFSPTAIPGDIRGYSARTGDLLWTFHVVPENGEPGAETWERNSNEYTGHAGVWTTFSADPDLGLVYLPTEAPTHDWYGGDRLGDNLYSSSLVALDVQTGDLVWHYQVVHHDIWDFDNPAAPILVDIEVDGRPIRAVVLITKQGWAFVFDRETGKPVWPIEERAVPQSNIPGERTSPTQPFPTKPPAFSRQGVSEDDLIDFTPELREKAREALANLEFSTLYSPVRLLDPASGYRGALRVPRSTGGGNWEGGAVDPETGILYVTSQMSPAVEALEPAGDGIEADYTVARGGRPGVEGLPILKPPYGEITAIDLNRGEILWQIPNADTPDQIANHPALAGIDLPRTGRPARVGQLATRTLLFAGEGVGGKPILRAYDKATGEILAELELPAPQTGLPMSYMLDGIQYLVVAVAGQNTSAEFVAFRLP